MRSPTAAVDVNISDQRNGGAGSPFKEFSHRLPRARVVDRRSYLLQLARGRRVFHLGFVDEGRMSQKRGQGIWLHDDLARAADELVGIDLNARGVELASKLGFEALTADCQSGSELAALHLPPADLLIAGELIEHLDQPGAFLEAIKCLVEADGTLVITTPNAVRLTNFLGSIAHRELVNSDHVGWYSWHVLKSLLERHGWCLRQFAFYAAPGPILSPGLDTGHWLQLRAVGAVRAAMRPLFAIRPALADGVIAVASLAPETVRASR